MLKLYEAEAIDKVGALGYRPQGRRLGTAHTPFLVALNYPPSTILASLNRDFKEAVVLRGDKIVFWLIGAILDGYVTSRLGKQSCRESFCRHCNVELPHTLHPELQ